MYGDREPAFIRRQATNLATKIPNASVREVPGAGHTANLDEPEFVTDALEGFLAELDLA
jgi:pimeloyl-ACP methyl ester carboxylesterase